jgi:hypothetical protein
MAMTDQPIHLLKTLGPLPNRCPDESAKELVRKEFLKLVLDPKITTDPEISTQETDYDDALYVGSHKCQQIEQLDVFVELWANSDEPETDWLGWVFFINGSTILSPLTFCPYCGVNLYELIA